jgi:AraC-like DNA-binding protein
MDVLSDALALMRTGSPLTTRARRSGTWAERHGPFPGAGFHIVLRGACWLQPAEGEPLALGPGDVVLLPRGSEHALCHAPRSSLTGVPTGCPPDSAPEAPVDWRGAVPDEMSVDLLCGAYQLDRDLTHPLFAEMPDIIHLPASVGSRPSLRAAVELLGGDLREEHPGSGTALSALLDLLLVYIVRAYLEERTEAPSTVGWQAALADPAINTALRSMHEDPARPWTVQELGARAGLSRAAFARRFTALVGRPPLAYLTWWRLSTAARLLRQGDAPLASIASQVGYTSQFAFAHAFKREFGQTAGSYRSGRRRAQHTA